MRTCIRAPCILNSYLDLETGWFRNLDMDFDVISTEASYVLLYLFIYKMGQQHC
jgi:hypothetical protein